MSKFICALWRMWKDPIVQKSYRYKDLMLFVGDTVRLINKREGNVTAFRTKPDRPGVYARVVINVATPNSSNETPTGAIWVPMHSIEKVICSGTAATAIKLEPLPDNDVAAPVWHRRMKRGCCCLFFLLVLSLFAVAYIAKKVEFISQLLRYMPGGMRTHPFCSDLCDGNEKSTTITCEISDCMDACSNYFMPSANEDCDDADMTLTVSMTNDDIDTSNNEYESDHGARGSHGGRSSSSSEDGHGSVDSEHDGHPPPCANNGGPGHGGAGRS